MLPGDFSKYAAKNVIVPKGMIDKARKALPVEMFGGPEMRSFRPGKMPRSQVESLLSRVGLSGTDIGYGPMKMSPSVKNMDIREAFKVPRRHARIIHGRGDGSRPISQRLVELSDTPAALEVPRAIGEAGGMESALIHHPEVGPFEAATLGSVVPPPGRSPEWVRSYMAGSATAPHRDPFSVSVPQWLVSQSARPDDMLAARLRTVLRASRGDHRIVPGSIKSPGLMDRVRRLWEGTPVGRGVQDLPEGLRSRYQALAGDPLTFTQLATAGMGDEAMRLHSLLAGGRA